MDDFGLLTLITIISAAMGFTVAGLLGSLRKEKSLPPEERASRYGAPPTSGLKEVARFWRDPRQGRLVIELDGKLVRFAGETGAAELEQLAQLHAALGTMIGNPAPGARQEPRPPEGRRQLLALTQPLPRGEESDARPGHIPAELPLQTMPAETSKPAAPRSMVAQIDEILQEKLAQGHLKQRAIRLMELPGRGMVVLVGLEQYAGVEEVPDPEIRDLIRQCVAEWETSLEGT